MNKYHWLLAFMGFGAAAIVSFQNLILRYTPTENLLLMLIYSIISLVSFGVYITEKHEVKNE